MVSLVVFIVVLFAYAFYVEHTVVFVLGFIFAMPFDWFKESDEYNSDEDNFLYLMKIVTGVATLASAIYYGWQDLYRFEVGDSVAGMSVNLLFMIMVFVRLKLIFEGDA